MVEGKKKVKTDRNGTSASVSTRTSVEVGARDEELRVKGSSVDTSKIFVSLKPVSSSLIERHDRRKRRSEVGKRRREDASDWKSRSFL